MEQNAQQNKNELPIIVLPGLEGNTPMQLTSLQVFLQNHITELVCFWWSVWCITALYLLWSYIIKPLREKIHRK